MGEFETTRLTRRKAATAVGAAAAVLGTVVVAQEVGEALTPRRDPEGIFDGTVEIRPNANLHIRTEPIAPRTNLDPGGEIAWSSIRAINGKQLPERGAMIISILCPMYVMGPNPSYAAMREQPESEWFMVKAVIDHPLGRKEKALFISYRETGEYVHVDPKGRFLRIVKGGSNREMIQLEGGISYNLKDLGKVEVNSS